MKEQDRFQAAFNPLPDNLTLPSQILADYEAVSCLSHQEV